MTAASFSTVGPNNCVAINKEVDMVTVGFWQNLFKGSYGRVAGGLQWEYIQRKSFDTVATNAAGTLGGGAVSTSDNVFLTSLRYYPFRRQHLLDEVGDADGQGLIRRVAMEGPPPGYRLMRARRGTTATKSGSRKMKRKAARKTPPHK